MRETPIDLNFLHEFFKSNGWNQDYTFLEWKYFKNIVRQLYVNFAIESKGDTEILAASYGVIPQLFKIGDKTEVAVLSLDTLTGAGYRRLGLFTKLAKELYQRCEKEGIALIYGMPNKNSAPGFFNRLGWINLGMNPVLVRPLRLGAFIIGVPVLKTLLSIFSKIRIFHKSRIDLNSHKNIRIVEDFKHERYDRLWKRFSESIKLCTLRDSRYLQWRIIEKPENTYLTFAYFEKEKPVGFITYNIIDKYNTRIGCIMELIYEPGLHDVGKKLLDIALSDITVKGGELSLALNFSHSPNHQAFKRAGYFKMPEVFNPLKIYFGIKPLKEDEKNQVSSLNNWYLSFLDADTI